MRSPLRLGIEHFILDIAESGGDMTATVTDELARLVVPLSKATLAVDFSRPEDRHPVALLASGAGALCRLAETGIGKAASYSPESFVEAVGEERLAKLAEIGRFLNETAFDRARSGEHDLHWMWRTGR
jgi:hypothetical protein